MTALPSHHSLKYDTQILFIEGTQVGEFGFGCNLGLVGWLNNFLFWQFYIEMVLDGYSVVMLLGIFFNQGLGLLSMG